MESVLAFDLGEAVAVTADESGVQLWTAGYSSNCKVFEENGRKKLLSGDSGYRWKKEKKTAKYCEYASFWFGDFPYSSWCYAIRRCLVTGEVQVSEIATDINSRGPSTHDRWIANYQSYVPSCVEADHILA
jgi:hypothetical protein